MRRVALTDFANERHFGPGASGTVITSQSPGQFEAEAESRLRFRGPRPGYADFCKLVFVENWTDARAGTLPITPGNERFLKSGYRARAAGEMPVLVRWFEGIEAPTAKHLCLVLYDRDQLAKEGSPVDADHGIVAILGQMTDLEEPMPPITMWRNALGTDFGGSGAASGPEAYARSVEFWGTHAIARPPDSGAAAS